MAQAAGQMHLRLYTPHARAGIETDLSARHGLRAGETARHGKLRGLERPQQRPIAVKAQLLPGAGVLVLTRSNGGFRRVNRIRPKPPFRRLGKSGGPGSARGFERGQPGLGG